jgi:hypothetical protein
MDLNTHRLPFAGHLSSSAPKTFGGKGAEEMESKS